MAQIKSLENISSETLDKIVEKYKDNKGFRINDDRERISRGKKSGYFLFANNSMGMNKTVEWTFIWIGCNLWQFRYCNTSCTSTASWKNPLDLLNELLKS